ncbi:MAG: hypothetical protein A3J93_02115 [Candidatus Magasanikbacteria bacterium RIFOXYC2_FULL_42_28]|uniref:Penicillin-binding protein transpeptidase domain-containing protein n=1 Tax=Candidatus Magasanikbacteria bacterium RIFOXYC2_FULL_42_28 TaxID=1798704 RepID=A0A1F6NX50_9BACT|nr:MAG: hypothetical protein A3J93_02115 [Candidatus Magasanikbacteria bacterium RIFOXYC2_FULL_42_28]
MLTTADNLDKRITTLGAAILIVGLIIITKLFVLQVLEHNFYSTFALSTREIYRELYPERGKIFWSDSRTGETYLAAVNRQYWQIYAVPNEIDKGDIVSTTKAITNFLDITDKDKIIEIQNKLSKAGDPYEPIAKKITADIKDEIQTANLPGIYATPEDWRYYPENDLGGNILGFVRPVEQRRVGNYGVEGFLNETLAGSEGFIMGERSALGSLISLAGKTLKPAEAGADVVLTIDRALETEACAALYEGYKKFETESAALVMINPKTGAILAMCSFPSFDPNNYSKVEEARAFNNTAIFTAYEPGSVMKPLTVAMAIDQNLISPGTTFTDPCERIINGHKIKNAEGKCYHTITMTEALEQSVNLAMIHLEEILGRERFSSYAKKFGLGQKTGISAATEMAGDISSLDKTGEIYGANASFGQGFTATPLQFAAAYSALANEGRLPKPYLVSEIRYSDGRVEKTQPEIVEAVISARTAKLVTGMLVSVAENGHSRGARIPGYFIAGKTGTAQIAEKGGYSNETNHTFAGFGPAGNPKIVVVVKYEKPNVPWAESTATVAFKRIMDFAIKYYGLEKER